MNDVRGRLGAAFRGVQFSALNSAFLSAAPEAAHKLHQFYQAARALSTSEGEFNRRSRPEGAAPSLMSNLRDGSAVRNFRAAKDALLEATPEIAAQIVSLAQHQIDTTARGVSRTVALKQSI